MGDVIIWKTAEELMEYLAEQSALVAGMGEAEAAATLGFTKTASGMYVKTITETAVKAGVGATAGEAIAGAAATGGATTTAANLTLYTTAEGTTAVGALGSIALPIAACAIAGASGYTLGNIISDEIDKKYPDFFNGMFESISEFLTGDERSLAFIFDKDGNTYMPEASQQAINEYLQNQISLPSSNYVNCDGTKVQYTVTSVGECRALVAKAYGEYQVGLISGIECESPVYTLSFYGKYTGINASNVSLMWISKSPFTISIQNYDVTSSGDFKPYTNIDTTSVTISQTVDEYTFYGLLTSIGKIEAITNCPLPIKMPIINTTTPEEYHDLSVAAQLQILFGEQLSDSKVPPSLKKEELPEKPKIEVPSTFPTWIPIPMPVTAPNQMPTEFPSFTPENDPSRVTPYLPQPQPYPETAPVIEPTPNPDRKPLVIPVPTHEPVKQPTPSPDVDPSAEPVPNPNPAPKPTPTPKPDDTGKTPTPILPVVPPISSEADGLLHVYNPTSAQINEFGRWLWTTFSGDLIDTIAKLFNNPMDAVIGLHELYCTPSTGSSTTIKAGFLDSGVTSRLVDSRYTEINCGAITVPEYWGNYLDYSPYTKVYCYLPFIGIVELNTDDIVGHGVQITYKIDSYNGSCVAMITTAKKQDEESVVYQFSGNCAVEVPITSGMKSVMQSALIGAATCAVGAMAAGAAGSVLTDAAISGGMKRGLNSKNTVAHSGTFGSSYGAMGIKKPYIIVKRPVQKVVHGYNKNYGYPAHSMVTIGNCSGYLRCRDFEVVSSTATEEEKKRIEILLKEGVYV